MSTRGEASPNPAASPLARPARLATALASLALALLVATSAPAASLRAQEESWLDQPLATWNWAGMPIPPATSVESANPACDLTGRWAETPQDQALVDAGWRLFGSYQAGWGLVVVQATSGYDGMCRPMGYQVFVFTDGQFAGTVSPQPMDSRSTGAGYLLGIGNGSLSARFLRYAAEDPLCCPSRPAAVVEYYVERTEAGPVLVPVQRFEEPS